MTIEQRIERLERQNRRLKWSLGGLVSLSFAGLLMGAAAAGNKVEIPNVLRAHKLEIVGSEGKPCVVLGMTANNTGTIATLDAKGTKIVTVGVTTTGEGSIATYNKKGNDLLKLSVTTSGEGVITTHDAGGQKLLEMGVTEKNQPKIFSYKADGKTKAVWP